MDELLVAIFVGGPRIFGARGRHSRLWCGRHGHLSPEKLSPCRLQPFGGLGREPQVFLPDLDQGVLVFERPRK